MTKMDIWHDAKLVTMLPSQDYGLIEQGAMVIHQGKIEWIGQQQALPKKYEERGQFHSAKGYCITPGLIDCHTHVVYAGDRAEEFELRQKGWSYAALSESGKGIYSTVDATRKISEKALLMQSAKRVVQFLQEGVTTLEIKSGYGLDFETERKILSVAKQLMQLFPIDIQTTFLGAHVLPKEFMSKKAYLDYILEQVLPKLIAENLIDAIDGFCDKIAFDINELDNFYRQVQQYHLPIKLHAEQLSHQGGAELAAKYHALSADHLEYIDEHGVKALKEADCVAVLLPGAHYYMKEKQLPPIKLFRDYQVPMALATDANPGTSPTISLLLMMNMGCILFDLSPLEALQGVTKHAAKALGLSHQKGQLSQGFVADFVLWDIDHPGELSYRFGDNKCYQVIKNGNSVYEKFNEKIASP